MEPLSLKDEDIQTWNDTSQQKWMGRVSTLLVLSLGSNPSRDQLIEYFYIISQSIAFNLIKYR